MNNLKKCVAIGCAAVALVSVAACGSSGTASGSQTVSFQTWNLKNDTYTPYFNSLIRQFEREHPGVTVKWVDQPAENYDQKLSTDAAAGQLPDVVNVSETQAYNLAKGGALLNLSKEMPKAEKDYLPQVWKGSEFTGNGIEQGVYGFPWYMNIDVAYINKPLFEKCGLQASTPPKTYRHMFTQASSFARNCSTLKQYYLAIPRIMTEQFEEYGVPTMNAKHSAFALNSAKGIEYVQHYIDMYKEGSLSPDGLSSDTITAEKMYFQGNIAYMPDSTSSIASFKTNAPDVYKNLDVAPLVTNTTNTLNPMTFAVSSHAKNKQMSLKLANFLTNKKNQIAFSKKSNTFPSAAGAMNDPYFSSIDESSLEGKVLAVAKKEIMNGNVGNRAPEVSDTDDTTTIQPQITQAIKGQQSAKQALDNIVKDLNSRMSK